MKIVVIGGTGLIGVKAVALLREKGHDAVAASPGTGVNAIAGACLEGAQRGAQVIIVTNPPGHGPRTVAAFFRDATRNLFRPSAMQACGTMWCCRLSAWIGWRAIRILRRSACRKAWSRNRGAYSVVRAMQFFEFPGTIADLSTMDGTTPLSPHQFQPIAADDVTAIIVDIAGPEQCAMHAFIGNYLRAVRDGRPVIPDDKATYFGGVMDERSLVPIRAARHGRTSLGDWLDRTRLASPATA
ncbi:NmrA family transcriptional regulator [Paraburkholderia sp. SOS3]|uniref:NmrA family transcriptional regulator n=1 Tax=Paraburkholderia sp. SOS3 TaxID=1926494 RepID=UPI0026B95A84